MGRAIVGFMVWGIPSGYLAVMGKYPSWGAASAGLNPKDDQSKIDKVFNYTNLSKRYT
ncbi:MAG: hypothetical protein J7524_02250 [Roseofilum sp. Belize BBD 4]|uniref:hypothetical protein n=1 Tax=Roseofilum sp. Belize BBD 4 TaxID=2821500 RepID=UPI001B2D4DE5|nr:hypothetical protein [Roseofilum sp. Belize BBD 4]MBP0031973.1 hypothetical protein [Roseofilum sp. Belize BBD 4]